MLATLFFAREAWAGWTDFGTQDGLPGGGATHVACHEDGQVWVVISSLTEKWLCHRAGRDWELIAFRPLEVRDGDRFPRVLAVSASDGVWLADSHGLWRYDHAGWAYIAGDSTRSQVPQHWANRINSLLEDRNGILWVGTNGDGLFRFDGSSWSQYTMADGLASLTIESVKIDRSGGLWISHDVGRLSTGTMQGFTTIAVPSGESGPLVIDLSGSIWVGTESTGLHRYRNGEWQTYPPCPTGPCYFQFPSDRVVDAAVDRLGRPHFITPTGLVVFDGLYLRRVATPVSLVSGRLATDALGNLWVASGGAGLWRHDGEEVLITHPAGVTNAGVWFKHANVQDRRGRLWIADPEGGVYSFDGGWENVPWMNPSMPDDVKWGVTTSLLCDQQGRLWFGGRFYGVWALSDTTWTHLGEGDGLASDTVIAMARDSLGGFWCASAASGLSHVVDGSVRVFGVESGLLELQVSQLTTGASGELWVSYAQRRGVISRFDGNRFTTVPVAGADTLTVTALLGSRDQSLWVGCEDGSARRLLNGSWQTYGVAEGLSQLGVFDIVEDDLGSLWFASPPPWIRSTGLFLVRFFNERWSRVSPYADFLIAGISTIAPQAPGMLWVLNGSGNTWRLVPDHTAPGSYLSPAVPDSVIPSRTPSFEVGTDFAEPFAYYAISMDGGPWTPWSQLATWTSPALGDGRHEVRAIARDASGNIDPTPARHVFVVDATPPRPVIGFPVSGSVVSGEIPIIATTDDARFARAVLLRRHAPDAPGDTLAVSLAGVRQDTLYVLDTRSVPDGPLRLQIVVEDALGLTGSAEASIIVDNQSPAAHATSPARIAAAHGGDVYTTAGDAHLYVAPNALGMDVVVTIDAVPHGEVPERLGTGALLLLPGFDLAWGGLPLNPSKPATLDIAYAVAVGSATGPTPALYRLAAADTTRVGGTVDPTEGRLYAQISESGRYALFAEVGGGASPGALSGLSIVPRVLSAGAGAMARQVTIGFTLGSTGSVSVKIHNRAGRLIRKLVNHEVMNAGSNVVLWNGADDFGGAVEDGLYLVAVEALQDRRTQCVVVVR